MHEECKHQQSFPITLLRAIPMPWKSKISLSESQMLHKSQALLFGIFQAFLCASHLGAVDSRGEAFCSFALALVFAAYLVFPWGRDSDGSTSPSRKRNGAFLLLVALHLGLLVASCMATIANFPQMLPMKMLLVGCFLLVHLIFVGATFWLIAQGRRGGQWQKSSKNRRSDGERSMKVVRE